MTKKIIIISKEFKSNFGEINVDSRFYDDKMNPIISNAGVDMDLEAYHLGQVSTSFNWAKKDMSYERYKKHFDKLFPEVKGDFEFDFKEFKIMKSKIELKKDEVYSIGKFTIEFDEDCNCLKITVEDPRFVILTEPITNN